MPYRRASLLALIAVGIGVLIASAVMSEGGFPSALLLEVGSGIFLFAALYWIEHRFVERRVVKVEERTEQLQQDLGTTKDALRKTQARLDQIGDMTRQRLQKEREEDQGALSRFSEQPSRESLLELIDRAERLEAISERGLRVQVPLLWTRLRFRKMDEGLAVVLENLAGEELETVVWIQGDSTDVFMTKVAEALMRHHEFPGDSSFDATKILEKLRSVLELSMKVRRGDAGPVGGLAPVIEVPGGQWAVTEAGIECIEEMYPIASTRFDETDWEQHVAEKIWVDRDDFHKAWLVATALAKGKVNHFRYWDNDE